MMTPRLFEMLADASIDDSVSAPKTLWHLGIGDERLVVAD